MSSFIKGPPESEIKTRIINGGLLKADGKIAGTFDEIYNSPVNEGGTPYRPIPGVKDISVEYKGMLASLRSATINWTCWSLDELDIYEPNFLTHGATVLLE
jgi:hypothetical protein